MDGETASLIAGVAAVATGVLGYIGRELKYRHEERQMEKRADAIMPTQRNTSSPVTPPGGNGYVRQEQVRQMLTDQEDTCTKLAEAHNTSIKDAIGRIDGNVSKIFSAVDVLAQTVHTGLADHGARIGALERNPHGTRG